MKPAPQHGTPAGEATLAIQKLARSTGEDVQDLLTLYALEGLLTRLAVSPFRDDFVLKGGTLLAAFALRRPTRDIDLQATRLENEPDAVSECVQQVVSFEVDDGLMFDLDTIKATVIRDEDEYSGIRVTLRAMLGRANLLIGIDVNFGDPIWPDPAPVTIPRIVDIGLSPVTVLGYPLTMVLGEKIVTAIERGIANTRWRDFGDIYTIIRTHPVIADDLRTSLETTASYRKAVLVPLLPLLSSMPDRVQAKWVAWRSRSGRMELPEDFGTVLESISQFTDPILREEVPGLTWNPSTGHWENSVAEADDAETTQD